MSSSATTKAAVATDTPIVAPAVAPAHDPIPVPSAMVDETDRSYGRAIVVGSIVGIVLFTVAMGVIVKLLAPEWPVGAAAGIAVWCGIWSGLFLGGTVAVGRWSMRQGH